MVDFGVTSAGTWVDPKKNCINFDVSLAWFHEGLELFPRIVAMLAQCTLSANAEM